jgi:hypothetical protein
MSDPNHAVTRLEDAGAVTVATILRRRLFDDADLDQLQREIAGVIDAGRRLVLVDLGPLEYWESPGLERRLLSLWRRLHQGGGRLGLCSEHPDRLLVFRIMGWDRFGVGLFDDRHQALATLSGSGGAGALATS